MGLLYECVCLNWESKGGKGGVLSSYLVPRGKEVSFHFTEKEKRGKGIHTKGLQVDINMDTNIQKEDCKEAVRTYMVKS